MNEPITDRAILNIIRIVNELRKERNLPTVVVSNPRKITKAVIRQIGIEVWQKYPQSLTDPHYQLGEFTLELVNREIKQRIADLRKGVVIGTASLKDYFN